MAYLPISNYNITGMDQLFSYISDNVVMFFPMLLFVIFLVFLIGIYYGKERKGEGDWLVAAVVASFITTIISFLLPIKGGIINDITKGTCFALALILFAILWFTKRGE